jgi:hypothetical protein|tara:strand:+ start:4 stop:291 length:288 start_codon:yes stop_codon:yes gene_type:complete
MRSRTSSTDYIKAIIKRGWCEPKYSSSWGVEYGESILTGPSSQDDWTSRWVHDTHVAVLLNNVLTQMDFKAARAFGEAVLETVDSAEQRLEDYAP